MSAYFGRRLYAQLWDSAHPFLGRLKSNHITPNASRKVFDPVSNTRRLSTPSSPPSLTRRLASGGFLIYGVSPSFTAAEAGVKCKLPSKTFPSQLAWRRSVHTPSRSEKTHPSDDSRKEKENEASSPTQDDKKPPASPEESPQPSSAPSSGRHLMDRLPHMPHLHRPTKEELLAAATGFWSRLKVRFKWFSIRSARPFNLDEIAAFFSWVFLGHVVWVVVGTTTFFSLLILAINTVFAQGTSSSHLDCHHILIAFKKLLLDGSGTT